MHRHGGGRRHAGDDAENSVNSRRKRSAERVLRLITPKNADSAALYLIVLSVSLSLAMLAAVMLSYRNPIYCLCALIPPSLVQAGMISVNAKGCRSLVFILPAACISGWISVPYSVLKSVVSILKSVK